MGAVPKAPDWRTRQTTYRCGNEVARFTLRFDANSGARFSAAERGGRSLSGADLKKVGQSVGEATSRLRRFRAGNEVAAATEEQAEKLLGRNRNG